jgi:hypothetical protein
MAEDSGRKRQETEEGSAQEKLLADAVADYLDRQARGEAPSI